ncbi:BT_3928 family protein [Zunongwangia sp.]|uniref:BT_3928 family protein n=1 Tax=Zunongwangia sp. TaxID=1965325 RepID=UPI003AA99B5D
MQLVVKFARFFVGVLFIFSGFIKLNDPIGFSYKLQEYFSPEVLNLDFLTPFALAIAVLVCVFELVLGIMLLIGYLPKFTTWCLLGMIVFFTFLTFYSAYFNKVTDCGCFGDAIPLTPWQSFTKDIILLLFIIILFIYQKSITPILVPASHRWVIFLSYMLCFLYAYYVLMHLPVFDFRPYKIGNNIAELRKAPEDDSQDVFEYHWKFNVNGKEEIVTTSGNYPQHEGEYMGVETELISEGKAAPIHDFQIIDGDKIITDEVLAAKKVVLIVSYDLKKSEKEGFKAISKLAKQASKKGYRVLGLTASGDQLKQQIKKNFKLDFPFYQTDETALKTIIRANPGVLILNAGIITQKKHWSDVSAIKL